MNPVYTELMVAEEA